jgi:predicted Zn-dependent protease with MMP-like domain
MSPRVIEGDALGRDRLSEEECRAAAQDALDSLPRWVRERLGEVAVIVEDSDPEGLMGVYDPVGGIQRIVIFRAAHPSTAEVRRTVWHEVGHYLGMSEDQLAELGYG